MLLTFAALAVEEYTFQRYQRRRDTLRLLAYTLLENFGYHQLHDVWRAHGYIDIARGTTDWGAQQRRGFDSVVQPEVPPPQRVGGSDSPH
jgi:hypothetical protein